MTLSNSVFTNGSNSLIYANFAGIKIQNVTMHNSEDFSSHGHALNCEQCFEVDIRDSNFYDLSALQGGAIYLKETFNYNTTMIENNKFINNRASERAGAIILKNAGVVKL